MEGRVEDRDVHEVRERRFRLTDRLQGRLVVEWSEGDQRLDRLEHRVIDGNRLAERRTAVDDTVANCIRRLERRDRSNLASAHEVPLQARRASVHRENDGLALHVAHIFA